MPGAQEGSLPKDLVDLELQQCGQTPQLLLPHSCQFQGLPIPHQHFGQITANKIIFYL